MAAQKRQMELALLTVLQQCIRDGGGRMHVDAVMGAYPVLPYVQRLPNGRPVHQLPARGDLLRLIRRYPEEIAFDPQTYELVSTQRNLCQRLPLQALSRVIRQPQQLVDLTVYNGRRYRGLLYDVSPQSLVLRSAFTTGVSGKMVCYTLRVFEMPWVKGVRPLQMSGLPNASLPQISWCTTYRRHLSCLWCPRRRP